MPSQLIPSALRALNRAGKFKPSSELASYLRDNNIGRWTGENVQFGPRAKELLEQALKRDFQVPPGTTPKAWEGLSRTQALDLTTNEKTTKQAVRAERVAVKALKDAAVKMGSVDYHLPPGTSIDTSQVEAGQFSRHPSVILVENWEAFERVDRLNFSVPDPLRGALVVYRGDAIAYPIAAARAFTLAMDVAVHVFPDPDPAGLKLAMDYPGYAGLVLPPVEQLAAMFDAGRGDAGRYTDQLPGTERALESTADREIQSYWRLIKAAGRAIPQEEFVREEGA